jgi:hypothetical protein
MFFIGGVHRHNLAIGDRYLTCPICHRPASMHFTLRKRAVHLFWIPLFPAGSTAYVKCNLCGHEYEATDAPQDTQFYGFLGVSILLTLLGVLMVVFVPPTCVGGIPFLIGNIALSSGYLITVPGSYAGYPKGSEMTQPPPTSSYGPTYSSYQPAPTSYQTGQYTSPALASPKTSVTYDKDSTLRAQSGGFYSENHCPYCGMAIGAVYPGQVATCPYCKNQFAT